MWLPLFLILPFVVSSRSINVPVEQNEGDAKESQTKQADTGNIPIYYVSDDTDLDSYLIPPNPNRPEEVLPDNIVTPATYLLPPSQGQQSDYYYNPTEPAEEQTDWYPIVPEAPTKKLEAIPILYPNTYPKKHVSDIERDRNSEQNPRRHKAHEQTYSVPTPSLNLEPPSEDAPNDYVVPTASEQLQISESINDYDLPIRPTPQNELTYIYRPKVEQRLPLHLIPPQHQAYVLKKYPKKFYPKKYNAEFKPVVIPIAQYYADESASEIPRAKPVKLFKPLPSTEIDYLTPSDEKINYLYRKAENKQRLKGEELRQESPPQVPVEDTFDKPSSTEQDASESFRPPTHHSYPAPLKQKPATAPKPDASSAPAPDGRTEFRMHGMKGPHSYQFGYDTGKGKNRQFRYEERDNDGQVNGHYGYMDRYGKLRVVNYSAHPETGFHADASVETEP